MADHKITAYSEDGVWLFGLVDDYPFFAKVCDEASGFGIDCGRVIKLYIASKQDAKEIASYERGWDRFPNRKARTKDWLGRSFASANPCRSRRSGEACF